MGCGAGLDQGIGGHKRNCNTEVVINTDWKRITEVCNYSIKEPVTHLNWVRKNHLDKGLVNEEGSPYSA